MGFSIRARAFLIRTHHQYSMRILLTGSTGMIGSHLLEKLKKKHTIIEFSLRNGMDITKKEDCEKAVKNMDIIIHAAAELDETKGAQHMWETNFTGTKNLLEAAEKNTITQFIFLSSVGVYGEPRDTIHEESEKNPHTNYERSKKEAEDAVWSYQEVFPVTIIRPAIVIGPNGYWSKIFKIVQKGFPLIGNGKNTWQMIHVDDVVEFIALCVGNKDTYNEDYVVAEKEKHSLREIVDMMADLMKVKHVGNIPKIAGIAASYVFLVQGKLTGKKPLLIPPHVKRLFKNRDYDISKALKTGWKPKLSTKEALEKTFSALNEKKNSEFT